MGENPYDAIAARQKELTAQGWAPVEALIRSLLDNGINFRFELEHPENPGEWINVDELLAVNVVLHETTLAVA